MAIKSDIKNKNMDSKKPVIDDVKSIELNPL